MIHPSTGPARLASPCERRLFLGPSPAALAGAAAAVRCREPSGSCPEAACRPERAAAGRAGAIVRVRAPVALAAGSAAVLRLRLARAGGSSGSSALSGSSGSLALFRLFLVLVVYGFLGLVALVLVAILTPTCA